MTSKSVSVDILELGDNPNLEDIVDYIKEYVCPKSGSIQILNCFVDSFYIEVEFVNCWCIPVQYYGASKNKISIDKIAYGIFMKLRKGFITKEAIALTEEESDNLLKN